LGRQNTRVSRMRVVWLALLGAVTVLAARPLHAQVAFLQNDGYTGGAVSCHTGIGMYEGLAAKFTAAPGQYPYTINRIRVFGCGGGSDAYGVQIYQDNGTATPGPLIWNGNVYGLDGNNAFNDILMSNEPVPPPPITSGSIRVFLINQNFQNDPIGFGADTNGIQAQRNFLVNNAGVWSFAEDSGVTGDWIFRLGIDTTASADVAVTITDGQASAVPGQPVTYTLVATNAGPDPVTGAKVTDTLPAALVGATWSCTASAGSNCAATGSGNIDDTVGLLPSGTLTYTLTATLNPAATGSLANTAAITLAPGATDPTPTNNTASDTDTLTPRADLSVAQSDSPDPVAPGATLTYTLQVTNLGPSSSTGMTLLDPLPPGVSFVSSNPGGPTCTLAASLVTCHLGGLGPAASQTVTLVVTVAPATSGPLSNTASVTGNETDLQSANNSNTEVTTVSTLPLGLRFYTVTPCRVVDTRGGSGVPFGGPPLDAQSPRVFALGEHCNVPGTAKAVSLNITVTQPGAAGNLRLFPGGLALPLVSTLNYVAGQTRANNAVTSLNATGEIAVFAGQAAGTTVQVIIDVNGYFE
jgi:uncharacterized repeat protein (TIGR01451 family)